MKQFIQDLSMMPEFYRCKRQGQIWLEPKGDGEKECKCLAGSNRLNLTSEAYQRLQALAGSYVNVGLALLISGGAMIIMQLARI